MRKYYKTYQGHAYKPRLFILKMYSLHFSVHLQSKDTKVTFDQYEQYEDPLKTHQV